MISSLEKGKGFICDIATSIYKFRIVNNLKEKVFDLRKQKELKSKDMFT